MSDVVAVGSSSADPTREISAQLGGAENVNLPVEQRLWHLRRVETMLLESSPGSALLDNFLEEVLRFMDYGQQDPVSSSSSFPSSRRRVARTAKCCERRSS
ncbi:hypothetical protein L596_011416 [Steinernema carpocapsae]|uniref:Uncharacterized protein n=1 Tax=Steinernema carpocapsae TaxID=34508 RepID=A0A4U5NTT6_STECR|nr:hypothetical protein L596_011416 [Steinernema carpocapsae]